MFSFLADIGFGAITGLIGSISTSIAAYKMQKLKNEHEVAMEKETRLTIAAETTASVKIEEARLAAEIERGDAKGFALSQEAGAKALFKDSYMDRLFTIKPEWLRLITAPIGVTLMTGFGVIDFLRGLMRPGLTTYYTVASGYLTYLLWNAPMIGGMHLIQNGSEIFADLVAATIYLSATCASWWLGDRSTSKFISGLKSNIPRYN